MTRPLNVMVIESHGGAGAEAARALGAAGHRVQRCHDDDSRGFPCRGVIDPTDCPLARHTDVALLVRRRVTPTPTALEQGVACAIRAGVPVVEAGPDALDPYGPWVAARVEDDVVATCEAASEAALGGLRRDILRLAGPVFAGAGITAGEAECRLEPDATQLRVRFDLPSAVAPAVKQALAVRVLDAVRGGQRTYGPVQVTVHGPAHPPDVEPPPGRGPWA